MVITVATMTALPKMIAAFTRSPMLAICGLLGESARAKSSLPYSNWPTTEIALSFSEHRDRCYPLAQACVDWCGDLDHSVLWVTEWGIWASSENLHLYYTVRKSYGDLRALWEAPGHEFLKHERAELVTFLDIWRLCSVGAASCLATPSQAASRCPMTSGCISLQTLI